MIKYILTVLLFIVPVQAHTQGFPANTQLELIDISKGVHITLPDDKWTIKDTNKEIEIESTLISGAKIRMMLMGTQTTVNAFYDTLVQAANQKGVKLFHPTQLPTLNGASEIKTISAEDTSKGVYQRMIIYSAAGQVAAILFETRKDTAEQAKPVFTTILQSIKVTPPAVGAIGILAHGDHQQIWAPNAAWDVYYKNRSITLELLNAQRQNRAVIFLHPTGHNPRDLEIAYAEHKAEVARRLPGAVMVSDHQPATLPGNTPALVYTYKNPSELTVLRDYVFQYRGVTHELNFEVLDADYPALKTDLKWIVDNIRLH